jgi:hypothetical protein
LRGTLGYLLAQEMVAAGEQVLDVQSKLAARVRLGCQLPLDDYPRSAGPPFQ